MLYYLHLFCHLQYAAVRCFDRQIVINIMSVQFCSSTSKPRFTGKMTHVCVCDTITYRYTVLTYK